MLPKDLVTQIENGNIEKMIISRSLRTAAWSVSAYGTALPTDVVNMIELNPEGCQRLWADLDAAYSFIRKCGFQLPVLIVGTSKEPLSLNGDCLDADANCLNAE